MAYNDDDPGVVTGEAFAHTLPAVFATMALIPILGILIVWALQLIVVVVYIVALAIGWLARKVIPRRRRRFADEATYPFPIRVKALWRQITRKTAKKAPRLAG